MFLNRMVFRSLSRQLRRRILIAVSVGLSTCVCVAMLGIVFDVGDKLNAELSTYGSNIVVQPKSDAVISDLYSSGGTDSSDGSSSAAATAGSAQTDPTAFMKESDVQKIKTIFWAYNITDFAPQLNMRATVGNVCRDDAQQASCSAASESAASGSASSGSGRSVAIVGTWFAKTLNLDTGESTVVGIRNMRSWWKVTGRWASDKTVESSGVESSEAMIGSTLAQQLNVQVGGSVTLHKSGREQHVRIVGIFQSGDSDDNAIYMPSEAAENLNDTPNSIDRIEVKALTTPENDLARKAARNPAALSQEEWETWYCTAYPSSIAYQIEEVIPGAVAKQVRQVAALQGDVLKKTQAVMILMTVLSLISAAIAVANLMAASIGERSSEFALLKAIGASDGAVIRLTLLETAVVSLVGALVGTAAGFGAAQVIGRVVFGSSVSMRPMVFVLVFVLLAVTILLASLSAIRSILGLRPAEVLHGR
ncbi:ABC transporter permease [Bifidobacterium aquikefiricola]|uniref:ABC transporter permease n=1 Tax=Bifidobacterium aquikefiricola TaxID=3059038 RepID=A0AB39U7F5_9BIFI